MFLNWTEPALGDLQQIYQYYCDEISDGDETGRKIVRRIYSATHRLKQLPFTGRPGRIPGTHELIVKNTPYIVYYEVMGDMVHLLRVLHTFRLLDIAFYASLE